MTKSTAVAHPIQGLIKYHGLKNKELRLPYHDSISVCMEELYTTTTVQTMKDLENDLYIINGEKPSSNEESRMKAIVDRVREISHINDKVLAVSKNMIGKKQHSYDMGKGLGYSSSGGAALAEAVVGAFGLNDLLDDRKKVSTIARRLAGSAARSSAGGFARWYASEIDEKSYAEQIAGPEDIPDFRMIVYPIKETSGLKTELAHPEVETSPLFKGRLCYINSALDEMTGALNEKNIEKISHLTEKDSLILHAVTMTGINHLVAFEPESIAIFKAIKQLRNRKEKPINTYVSWDTGPSTYINTDAKYADEIISELRKTVSIEPIVCKVGGRAKIVEEHLF